VTTLGANMPIAMQDLYFDLHLCDYTKSIAAAGGLPVQLTRDADVVDMIARLDGLVIAGGADIDPARYGEEPEELLGTVEPERDAWEFALYQAARSRGIPVLGICRGFQLVNVAHGGSLVQDVSLDEGAGHPQWDVDGRTHTHSVRCVVDTIVADVYGSTLDMPVNSLHHQVVKRLGEGLVVGAVASDGVVEAVTSDDGRVLAVQWHPELLNAPDPSFTWLVDACRAVASE
jgi:putative glutamine amidotransferase